MNADAKAFDHKEYTAALPKRPGVYRMLSAEHELLYVGKAKSLRDRVGTYFAAGNVNPKVQALVQQIAAIEVTVTNSETEALLLEYNLIKAHKPRYNVVLRDVATGRARIAFADPGDAVVSVAFSPSGDTVAGITQRSRIILWDAASGFRRAVLSSDEGLLMTPRRTDTDGFYVSILRRGS